MSRTKDSVEAEFSLTVDELAEGIAIAGSSPESAHAITPAIERYISLFRETVHELGPVSRAELFSAKETPDHQDFKYICLDLATVCEALRADHPAEFPMGIIGGEAFFRHVEQCPYCLCLLAYSMHKDVDEWEIAITVKTVAGIISAMQRLGITFEAHPQKIKIKKRIQ